MTAALSPHLRRLDTLRRVRLRTLDLPCPQTPEEVRANARAVLAAQYFDLARDDRDDDPHDAIGVVGFGRATPRRSTSWESPAETCRRYLREWRSIRRRWTLSTPYPGA
jgi:hypothetical protein